MSSKSRKSVSTSSSNKSSAIGNGNDGSSIMTTSMIAIIYNLLVLSYIVQLEGAKCGCITDWRHDFIKYYSIALIVWGIITMLFNLGTTKHQLVSLLKNILMFGALINIWCLYTYVGDLDKTKCMCAIDKQKNMHYFLYVWRYVLVGTLILSLLGVIFISLDYNPKAI